MEDLIRFANYYVRKGMSVIPISRRKKSPDAQLIKKATGQTGWKIFTIDPPTKEQVTLMFGTKPAGIGIITGFNNLVVLDFDSKDAWEKWNDWALPNIPEEHVKLLTSFTVQTARGIHIYLQSNDLEGRKLKFDIDIKAKWGYVLAPPTIHPNGSKYTALIIPDNFELPFFDTITELFPEDWIQEEEVFHSGVKIPIANLSSWDDINDPGIGKMDNYEEIKLNTSIIDMFPNKLEIKGAYARGRCPFHKKGQEKHASFFINLQTNMCGCFADNCDLPNKGVTVFGFYSRLKGISVEEAIKTLCMESQ